MNKFRIAELWVVSGEAAYNLPNKAILSHLRLLDDRNNTMNDDLATTNPLVEENRLLLQRIVEFERLEVERLEQAQNALAALKERENLLREVYHQTNNNLATICNLLYMQSIRMEDNPARQALRSAETRVRTMALIQEKFYRAKDITRLDLNELVKDISALVYRSWHTEASLAGLKFDLTDPLPVQAKVVIPIGLILHELISNALKYAFPDQRRGEVRVSLSQPVEGEVEMVVADNGIGISDDVDLELLDPMGLHLVQLLAERQLGGKVDLDSKNGTRWTIRFKV